jgi:hypothetical protein
MAIIFSLLISLSAIWFAASSGAMASTFLDANACPETERGAVLTTVTLFDGLPSEHADLEPDRSVESEGTTKSDWDVSYIFQSGRRLYVQCVYGLKVAAIILKPSPSVSICEYTSQIKGKITLTCLTR